MKTHWMVRDLSDKQGRSYADCKFDDRRDLGEDDMTNDPASVTCSICRSLARFRDGQWDGADLVPGADWTFDDSEAENNTDWTWRAAVLFGLVLVCLAFWFGVAWLVLP